MIKKVAQDAPLSEPVMREIIRRADGVPLFIEELTKSIIEMGDRQTISEVSGSPEIAAIPTTLQASLMSRLDKVGNTAKQIAQVGAASGFFGYGSDASLGPT
jgi:predicted ATPase